MDAYDRRFGTDWEELDRDEALDRAYALGVAASLGEPRPDELEAVRAQVDSSYDRSVIDLAFEEGRTAARTAQPETDKAAVWDELVEGTTVVVDDPPPTGGRSGLPEAIEIVDALERPDPDRNEAIERPDFLDPE